MNHTMEPFAHHLTAEDKNVLRDSWSHLSSSSEQLGVDIFVMICHQCPEVKPLFPWFRSYAQPNLELADTREFRQHAVKFVKVFERVIELLDNTDEIFNLTHNLAVYHSDNVHSIQPYLWATFLECSLYQIRLHLSSKKIYTPDNEQVMLDATMMLWRSVLAGIFDDIQMSFNACRADTSHNDRLHKSDSKHVIMIKTNSTHMSLLLNGNSTSSTSLRKSESSKFPTSNGTTTGNSTSRSASSTSQLTKRLGSGLKFNRLCANGIEKSDEDDDDDEQSRSQTTSRSSEFHQLGESRV